MSNISQISVKNQSYDIQDGPSSTALSILNGDVDVTNSVLYKIDKELTKQLNADNSTSGSLSIQGVKLYANGLWNGYAASGAAIELSNDITGKNSDTSGSVTIKGLQKLADSLSSNYAASGAAVQLTNDITGTNSDTAGSVTINGLIDYGEGLIKNVTGLLDVTNLSVMSGAVAQILSELRDPDLNTGLTGTTFLDNVKSTLTGLIINGQTYSVKNYVDTTVTLKTTTVTGTMVVFKF